jgi:hypothetical protein
MTACWNGLCVAGDCDGARHVDATGTPWVQERGAVFCPVHCFYHQPGACPHTAAAGENARWRRFTASGLAPGEFEALEAGGQASG